MKHAWESLDDSRFVRYEALSGRIVASLRMIEKARIAIVEPEEASGDKPVRFSGPNCVSLARAYVEGIWS